SVPILTALAASEIKGTNATANVRLVWAGSETGLTGGTAALTCYWSATPFAGAPETWGGTPIALGAKVADDYGVLITGLNYATPYYYYFFATNAVFGTCAWSEPVRFQTRGREFHWKHGSYVNGSWTDSNNWNDADGVPVPSGEFPRSPGDIMVLYFWPHISLDQPVTLGELRCANDSPTINASGDASITFDNKTESPYVYMIAGGGPVTINSPLILNKGLTIDNGNNNHPFTINGPVSGDDIGFHLLRGTTRWIMQENMTNTITGDGALFKDSSETLTLVGTNSFRFGAGGGETSGAGVAAGTLVFDGGVFTQTRPEVSAIFGGQHSVNPWTVFGNFATAIFKNGNKLATRGDLDIGSNRWEQFWNHTNNTAIVTGEGTAWNMNGKELHFRSLNNTLLVENGAIITNASALTIVGDNNLVSLDDGALLQTAVMRMDNGTGNEIKAAGNSQIGIASLNVRASYGLIDINGSQFACSGDMVFGGRYTDTGNTFRVVDGDAAISGYLQTFGCDSLVEIVNGTFACGLLYAAIYGEAGGADGPKRNVLFIGENAAATVNGFHLGSSCMWTSATDDEARDNFIRVDGGTMTSTADAFIGYWMYWGTSRLRFVDNIVLVGGSESNPGLLDMDGNNFSFGNTPDLGADAWMIGNGLEAAAYGLIDNINNLNVGNTAGYECNSNNFVRTNGGEIRCVNMTVSPNNGLAPVVTQNNGTGCVNVSGTATFAENTYVFPSAEKDAPTGKYLILQAETLVGASENLRLFPDSDDGSWKLLVDENNGAVKLLHSRPATILIVK
ncbi:MAG: hypothetical protein FWG05_05495, partial [Kiritimatiellaeota bacterium]|nr:hypothetical protein [Kiritimatiellota bacterium]